VIHVPSCHSTNLLAEQLLAERILHEGTVIITDDQTQGKGQKDKIWISEKGKNLTFSVILTPTFLPLDYQFYLNIIASLAIWKSIKIQSENVKVKWPNDVLINGRKVAGVLIKNILSSKRIKATIIGIGLNVNQKNFPLDTATSLSNQLNEELELVPLFESILMHLENSYLRLRNNDLETLKKDYLNLLYWKDEWHTFKSGKVFKGKILGINETGRLMVMSGEEILLFDNTDIIYWH